MTLSVFFIGSLGYAQNIDPMEAEREAARALEQAGNPPVISATTTGISGENNPGETCGNPIVVTALPFNDAGNTGTYGNNYDTSDVPPNAPNAVTTGTGSAYYLNGNEVVYAYTAPEDGSLNISTTNDDDWVGLWAFTGCPFSSTVGYHTATNGSTRSIEELPVTEGETYYFVISTWPTPDSTDYTILIENSDGSTTGPGEYCTPSGTNSSYYIDSFSTTGAITNISNLNSGFSPDGYGDFYDTHTLQQAQGEEVEFLAEFPTGETYGFRIWVDWNQDGVFDAAEEVAWNSTSYGNPHSGSFTVPADALEGETRMRIVGHWLNSSADIDPCLTGHTYGEFEDYKFVVGEGGGGSELCDITTAYNSNNGGSAGGAVYFDIAVKDEDIDISALDINVSDEGNSFTLEVYTIEGTYAGNEGDQSLWTLQTQGSGVGAGTDNPTPIELDDLITLSANTTYGIALVIDGNQRHRYTDGTGTNEHFENDNLELHLGSAMNTPFTGTAFSPRIFNGSIYYHVEGGCGGGGEPGESCEQDFYYSTTFDGGDYTNGVGNTGGNIVANDFIVPANTSFIPETLTFDMIYINGAPTQITLQLYEDDGSGGVGSEMGPAYVLSPGDYTANSRGILWGAYPGYEVIIDVTDANIELDNDTNEDITYWIGISQEVSTTGDFGYVLAYPSPGALGTNPTWQYLASDQSWGQYNSPESFESAMKVAGICITEGGDPSVYCEPNLDCSDGDVITNVSFQEIDNTTECSPDGYGDYTHLTATVQSGGTYPISVTVGDGWHNESVSVWIDFDNSGTFDEDEFFYIGTGSDETLTGEIDIPAGLEDGEYRMRVRVAAVGPGTATWDMACDESQGFGETEDYTVEVDGVIGIGDQPDTVFSYYPNPASEVVTITANKEIGSVAVYNILGQQVLSANNPANGQVTVSQLAEGSYIFRVSFEDGSTETFKIIKK